MTLTKILSLLKVDDNASTAQNQLYRHLTSFGYTCELEVFVPDRGDKTPGRIDLIAKKKNEVVAIEFDRHEPRTKSLFKLKHFDAAIKLVLLRGGNKNYIKDGIRVMSIKLYEYDSDVKN